MTRVREKALLIALLAASAALAFAFISQYVFDLWPCVLCIYQRWPYAAVIFLALAGMAFGKCVGTAPFLFLCALAFLATAVIGGYHVGVEQGWWEGTAECVGDAGAASSIDDLKARLMAAPLVRCDEVAWSLFGVSMAGYNVIFALVMAVFCLTTALSSRNRK